MLIIAGLGNPGSKYANNRHNIGFMAADEIARRHSFGPWRRKFKADIAEGKLCGIKTLLMKPQTMMNLSGEAIGEAMRFYKASPNDVLVIYDELDLAPSKVRMKVGGGAGGHNGIKSTITHCGAEFRRLRLGIGHPGDKARVNAHVLGDFAKAEAKWLTPLLEAIAEEACLLTGGKDPEFMNRLALATKGDNPKPKKQSHIHKARSANNAKKSKPEPSGPMAHMLKKLFNSKDD